MNIIILGDKFQKRMKSKGCVGLIKINNKSIVQYQYRVLRQVFPKANIVYVYGFESKRFYSFVTKNDGLHNDMISIYNANYDRFNSAYSLYLANSFLNEDTLVMFGDTILSKKTFNKFVANDQSKIFISKKQKYKLGCIINGSKIENISYDLENYLANIYYLSKTDSMTIKNILDNHSNHNCFIFEVVNRLIDLNKVITPFFCDYSSNALVYNKG